MINLIDIKPSLEEIKTKINEGGIKGEEENQFYELKECENGLPDNEDFFKGIISFYNSLGGYFIIKSGDKNKTNEWIKERKWASIEKYKKNKLEKLDSNIESHEKYSIDKDDYFILEVKKSNDPFEFIKYDGLVPLRIGAHTKQIKFNDADVEVLKEIMKKRMSINSIKNSAKFWELFCKRYQYIWGNELNDNSKKDFMDDSIVKQSIKESINSKNIGELYELNELAIRLNENDEIKTMLNNIMTAIDIKKFRSGKNIIITSMYEIMKYISEYRKNSEKLDKLIKWLKKLSD
ncbi:MAG: hypothetical protein WC501_02540 [Candidatus Micrarchaeia archaeon]|jgi:hypothetical protein